MVFNSFEYLVFLPIVFVLYWFVLKKLKEQNILIVLVSYLFYGLWDWRFLILIFITSFLSYVSGILLEKYSSKNKCRYIISTSNIVFNLLILCIFKYLNFFGEGFSRMLNAAGVSVDWVTLDIILPVGISFYTFQALSYTIDVYKRKIVASQDFIAFLAYISFFPQLVAGPIERASRLLPQFLRPRKFEYANAVNGMRLILLGLAKKMLIADNCGIVVDRIFEKYWQFDGMTLLCGGILFAFQIYGDFSGYSDIARGSGKLLGIELIENFKTPYFSRDISEFWRRWHISLNTWFRDYIYIPLGGSRCKKSLVIRNVLVIFLLSGLWHGANWTYVCWGAYNALLFIPLLLFGKNRRNIDVVAQHTYLPSIKELLQMCITFLMVVLGWIIFRSESMEHAYNYILCMISTFELTSPLYGHKEIILISFLILAEWIKRHKEHAFDLSNRGLMKFRPLRMLLYYVVFMATLLMAGEKVDFIYFQF